MPDTALTALVACPECGMRWGYGGEHDDSYSYLVGVYDRIADRTVEWVCPGCNHRWPRGATVHIEGDAR